MDLSSFVMCVVVWNVGRLLFLSCLLAWYGLLMPLHGAAQVARTRPIVFSGHQNADLSGTYSGHAPENDAAKRVFTLNLAADGTATLHTLYIGKEDATQHGRWKQTGNQVELTFDSMGGFQPPRPITFRHRDHQLSPIHWDSSEWGRSGPPVLHRSRLPAMATGLLYVPETGSSERGST